MTVRLLEIGYNLEYGVDEYVTLSWYVTSLGIQLESQLTSGENSIYVIACTGKLQTYTMPIQMMVIGKSVSQNSMQFPPEIKLA